MFIRNRRASFYGAVKHANIGLTNLQDAQTPLSTTVHFKECDT